MIARQDSLIQHPLCTEPSLLLFFDPYTKYIQHRTSKLQNYLFAFIPCSLSISQSNQVNQNVTSVGNSKGIIWLNHRVKHFTLRGRRFSCNVIRKRKIQLLSIRGLQGEDLKWLPSRSIISVCLYDELFTSVCLYNIMIISGTILMANQCDAQ